MDKEELRRRRSSHSSDGDGALNDVQLTIDTQITKSSSELPSTVERVPSTGQKIFESFGYKYHYFDGTPTDPPTPLSPSKPSSKPGVPNPSFFRRYWRLILGTVLAALLIIIAFTPIGHAIACLIVVKSVISPICEALMQSCLNIQITVGISALLIGYGLAFIDYLFLVPVWIGGMLLKATAKIANGCLIGLNWLLNCQEFSNAFFNGCATAGKIFLGFIFALGLFIFTTLANIGDKLLRRPSAPHALSAWENMIHVPIPTARPRAEKDFYKRNPDQPARNYFAEIIQDLKHMSYDVFQPTQNPDDYSSKRSP